MNLFSSFIWILTAFIPASRGITVTQPQVVSVSKGETATIECKTDAESHFASAHASALRVFIAFRLKHFKTHCCLPRYKTNKHNESPHQLHLDSDSFYSSIQRNHCHSA
ncbi:hypothetical protein Q8A67_000044 [Cirrhinus molitorella]|uniref:Uncharacterized protein n=1 Tax=Cirrhinus molitorella TaxID=172907 RepID=A0AA88TZU2_9TELE|nr:hypothetical protein Q8A67_000044 [Cirrhinus molitorella]